MRWRRKRRGANEAAPSDVATAYQPGSWGQSTLPPVEVDPVSPPTGNVEIVPGPPSGAIPVAAQPLLIAPLPQVQVPSPSPSPAKDESLGVRLGFEDGSALQLDPDHPHSLALKAVADLLLHKGPFRRP